jgi:hypothetical protein
MQRSCRHAERIGDVDYCGPRVGYTAGRNPVAQRHRVAASITGSTLDA